MRSTSKEIIDKVLEGKRTAGLSAIITGPHGFEWKGARWAVLDYKGDKVQLGAYKERGKVGKFFSGVGEEKFATRWMSKAKIMELVKKGEMKEYKEKGGRHVAR